MSIRSDLANCARNAESIESADHKLIVSHFVLDNIIESIFAILLKNVIAFDFICIVETYYRYMSCILLLILPQVFCFF